MRRRTFLRGTVAGAALAVVSPALGSAGEGKGEEGAATTAPFAVKPFEFEDEGQTTEPSVSVPIAAAHRFALAAAPEPELEPQGLRSSA